MKKEKNVSLCGGGGEFLNGSSETSLVEWFKGLEVEKSSSLRASEGCVAIQPRMLNVFTGLLRHYAPRNDDSARSALNSLVTRHSLLVTRKQAKLAFTMAEILLSLTIIGVVAAITLPSLTGNINERTWNTQRKALYSRMSQAISLMPAVNGYGTLDATDSNNVAEVFVTSGLSKVLKINNICDSTHLADCGIPNKITAMGGAVLSDFVSNYSAIHAYNDKFSSAHLTGGGAYPDADFSMFNTKAVAFETANGESVVTYYNPNCTHARGEDNKIAYFSQEKMCVNFLYDLNGKKGPNTVGKDVGFISVLYPTDSVVVAPIPLQNDMGSTGQEEGNRICKNADVNTRLPNRDELASMFYNSALLNMTENYYWSSSVILQHTASFGGAAQGMFNGERTFGTRTNNFYIRCVQR